MSASGAPLTALRGLLGAEQFLTEPDDLAPFLVDHRKLYQGRSFAVALPRDAQDVAMILRYCNQSRIGVVPQGGNTSYCGGATPDESGTQLILSLRRLNRIRSVDALNAAIEVEAGCVLAQVQSAAADANLLFPLSLGSEGSCQIGGNLATNAGGTSVLRYGMMRELVLGLEVVLADGRMMSSLSALRKDNTGYDLKSLFVGSEGTLGVITAATLKLFPAERSTATALVALRSPAAAVALLAALRAASGNTVSSFELMPRAALDLALRHVDGVIDPFAAPYPWYVLAELASTRDDAALQPLLEQVLAEALQRGDLDNAVLAHNERDRSRFWHWRESIPEAQRRHGYSLKHDISLPISALAEFVDSTAAWIAAQVPEGQLVAYGHVGDGNLHFNVSADPGAASQSLQAREAEIMRQVHDRVRERGGSFSAEHGIGRLKVDELARYASPVELAVMRGIKTALDPNGIMNPGKVLRS
jgi:FAD/FMN-containing dehydrogenase